MLYPMGALRALCMHRAREMGMRRARASDPCALWARVHLCTGHVRGTFAPYALGPCEVTCAPRALGSVGSPTRLICWAHGGIMRTLLARPARRFLVHCVQFYLVFALGMGQPFTSYGRRSDLCLMLMWVSSVLQYRVGSFLQLLNCLFCIVCFYWNVYFFRPRLIYYFDLCSSLTHKSSNKELLFWVSRRPRWPDPFPNYWPHPLVDELGSDERKEKNELITDTVSDGTNRQVLEKPSFLFGDVVTEPDDVYSTHVTGWIR